MEEAGGATSGRTNCPNVMNRDFNTVEQFEVNYAAQTRLRQPAPAPERPS